MSWSHFQHYDSIVSCGLNAWKLSFLPALSFIFFFFAARETETLNLIGLHDILHSVWRGWACFPICVIETLGGFRFWLRSCVSLISSLFIDPKLGENLADTGQAVCTSSLLFSLFTLSEGSGFNIELTPVFIPCLCVPLRTCRITGIQRSSERVTRPRVNGVLNGRAAELRFPITESLSTVPAPADRTLAPCSRRPGSEPGPQGGRATGDRKAKEKKAFPLLFLKPVLFWKFIYFFCLVLGAKGLPVMETGGRRFMALPLDSPGHLFSGEYQLPQPFSARPSALSSP